jgi:hypothetical protein
VRAIDTRKLGAIYPITAHPIARMDGEREKVTSMILQTKTSTVCYQSSKVRRPSRLLGAEEFGILGILS